VRRCLRCLLVGVLAFSLFVDAARACGHLRRWRSAVPCHPAPVVVAPWSTVCDPCGFVATSDGAWCAEAGLPVAFGDVAGCEVIACGTPVECCGEVVGAPVGPSSVVESPAIESAPMAPAEASAVASQPTPAEPQPVASPVPVLEPVERVSATEPAARGDESLTIPNAATEQPTSPPTPAAPEAAPEQPVVASPGVEAEPVVASPGSVEPSPGAPPQPRNVFEEVDEVEEADDQEQPPAAVSPAPEEPAVEPVPAQPAAEEPALTPEPDAAPALEAPAVDPPAVEPEPAVEPAAEPTAAAEPLRRWIDDTAAYAVVGRLIDVRGDAVEILRADGRSVVVPLARLSGLDREYVTTAAVRLAARRQAQPVDTASR